MAQDTNTPKRTLTESLTDALAHMVDVWCELENKIERKQFFIAVVEPLMRYRWNIINAIEKNK